MLVISLTEHIAAALFSAGFTAQPPLPEVGALPYGQLPEAERM